MSDLHTAEIDGVRAYWVDTGRPTLAASLVVRTGMVDETLATSGLTHLLEHLALHGRGGGRLEVNGSVSLLTTRFDAHGPPEDVVAFLAGVTSWLAAPQLGEMARERSVLRAESAMRSSGGVAQALLNRYGAQGPGLCGYAELGLAHATEDSLRHLAARAFTRGNAALFLDGAPPADVALHLPDGPLLRSPAATPCEVDLPRMYLASGAVISGTSPRTAAATLAGPALSTLFQREFRERDGSAYAPWAHYEPVDDGVAVVFAGTDAHPDLLPDLADRTLALLERAAEGDALDEVVPDLLARVLQAQRDPYNAPGLAFRAVQDHLRGRPPMSREDAVAEMEAVDTSAVREHVQDLRSTLLLGLEPEAGWRDQMERLSMAPMAERLTGTSHRSRNFPSSRDTFVIGADGLQCGRKGRWYGIHRDQIEGVLTYADGGREVVGRDGWTVKFEPTLWARGEQAVAAVDRLVPDQLRLPMPDRAPEIVPRPMKPHHHVKHAWALRDVSPWVQTSVFLALWIALVVGIALWQGSVPWIGVFAGVMTPIFGIGISALIHYLTRPSEEEKERARAAEAHQAGSQVDTVSVDDAS